MAPGEKKSGKYFALFTRRSATGRSARTEPPRIHSRAGPDGRKSEVVRDPDNSGTERTVLQRVVALFHRHACINKLSELEGQEPFYEIDGALVEVPDWKASGYRLPTEAEWEFACGGDPSDLAVCAWSDANAGNVTHPVGQKRHNRFGLYDLLGNDWEWC